MTFYKRSVAYLLETNAAMLLMLEASRGSHSPSCQENE